MSVKLAKYNENAGGERVSSCTGEERSITSSYRPSSPAWGLAGRPGGAGRLSAPPIPSGEAPCELGLPWYSPPMAYSDGFGCWCEFTLTKIYYTIINIKKQ